MKVAVLGSALRGGGVQVVDILMETHDVKDILIYDDDLEAIGKNVLGSFVVGPISQVCVDYDSGLVEAAVVAIGSVEPRKKVYEMAVRSGIPLMNVVSSRAVLSTSCVLGQGNVILPGVYIGPCSVLGDNNYLTTGSQINHDSCVGSHCYFSAGVVVAGRVLIGDSCRFDTSCCVTADAIVENGSLVEACRSYGPTRGR